MEIFLFTRLFDALVKIGPASVFTAGNLITGAQNLKSSQVSGFSAKEKGNPFDIIILKKRLRNCGMFCVNSGRDT